MLTHPFVLKTHPFHPTLESVDDLRSILGTSKHRFHQHSVGKEDGEENHEEVRDRPSGEGKGGEEEGGALGQQGELENAQEQANQGDTMEEGRSLHSSISR